MPFYTVFNYRHAHNLRNIRKNPMISSAKAQTSCLQPCIELKGTHIFTDYGKLRVVSLKCMINKKMIAHTQRYK